MPLSVRVLLILINRCMLFFYFNAEEQRSQRIIKNGVKQEGSYSFLRFSRKAAEIAKKIQKN
ncbi:hypothetical protein S225a_19590 [Candidatus Brocadiaceae bacterium S225]|nr:hypothetical protein S225a_19590 [Candidatus Brocadiaceae bacterium S225]